MSSVAQERSGALLKPGDEVVVRSADEILATLDEDGSLESVPFMPEMLQYVGNRYRVWRRAEKICDMVGPGGSRRLRDVVYLDDLRCDGSAHGGCQAECRIYWKEAWLRPVSTESVPEANDDRRLAELVHESTTAPPDGTGDQPYRCQATQAYAATTPLRTRDPGQYLREVRVGNITAARLLRVAVRAVSGAVVHRLGIRGELPMKLGGTPQPDPDRLDLRPGEWVEVKSAEEIGKTLDAQGRNRGLVFTGEMVAACRRRFRVRRRVERIVDERTGHLLTFKNDCISLDGMVCTGERSPGKWFCARESFPFWREAWLRRVDPPAGEGSTASS